MVDDTEGRMTKIKTWHIKECGWAAYFAEVAELSRGRVDVQIECRRPGVITLREVREVEA